eukprot:GSA25T00014890001.1
MSGERQRLYEREAYYLGQLREKEQKLSEYNQAAEVLKNEAEAELEQKNKDILRIYEQAGEQRKKHKEAKAQLKDKASRLERQVKTQASQIETLVACMQKAGLKIPDSCNIVILDSEDEDAINAVINKNENKESIKEMDVDQDYTGGKCTAGSTTTGTASSGTSRKKAACSSSSKKGSDPKKQATTSSTTNDENLSKSSASTRSRNVEPEKNMQATSTSRGMLVPRQSAAQNNKRPQESLADVQSFLGGKIKPALLPAFSVSDTTEASARGRSLGRGAGRSSAAPQGKHQSGAEASPVESPASEMGVVGRSPRTGDQRNLKWRERRQTQVKGSILRSAKAAAESPAGSSRARGKSVSSRQSAAQAKPTGKAE